MYHKKPGMKPGFFFSATVLKFEAYRIFSNTALALVLAGFNSSDFS